MSRDCPDNNDEKAGRSLVLHAAKSGLKTCLIQLQAGREPYEELLVDELLPNLNVFPALSVEMISEEKRSSWAAHIAKEALDLAWLALNCGKYDLVFLDEVQNALCSGIVNVEDIQELKSSPRSTNLVLLGISEDKDFVSTGDDTAGAGESGNQNNRELKTIAPQGREYEAVSLH